MNIALLELSLCAVKVNNNTAVNLAMQKKNFVFIKFIFPSPLTSSDVSSLYLTSPFLYSGGLRFTFPPAISNIDLTFGLGTEILIGFDVILTVHRR